MAVILRHVRLGKVDVRTRMPFRYGIATLTHVPYLLVFGDFEVDGRTVQGVAADVLPPKWFTKIPEATLDAEIEEMLGVIRRAAALGLEAGEAPSVFRWWRELYEAQMADLWLIGSPPLLRGLGASLLERAAIDAWCRRHEMAFNRAVRSNAFGIELEELHAGLDSTRLEDMLPAVPTERMAVRHTVGLADPLTAGEIETGDRANDGLPQSLDECIEVYRLTHFKIKLSADADSAIDRLRRVAATVCPRVPSSVVTLDGNEFFLCIESFKEYWGKLLGDREVRQFLDSTLLAVEQPLHRDCALNEAAKSSLTGWTDGPRVIIDESDSELGSFVQAIDCGYAGTSHKNCKGVFKGIANRCLIAKHNAAGDRRPLLMTGEDLMNLGPVALLQDLAVGATLGLTHMERNGHHFVAGLSAFSGDVQRAALANHGDLYHEHMSSSRRWPTLKICNGEISLDSINRSPFGCAIELIADEFDAVDLFP